MKNFLYFFGIPALFLTFFSFGFAQEPQEYIPLAQVPGLTPGSGKQALGQYINSIYTLSIGIGAVLAVLMIVVGGLQYMGTDIFSKKGEGKTRIQNALLGLGLLLASFLILQTVNNDLTSLNIELSTAESTATLSSSGQYQALLYCQTSPDFAPNELCYQTAEECAAATGEIFSKCAQYKKDVSFNGCRECSNLSGFNATLGGNACQTGGGARSCSAAEALKNPINQTANILTNSDVIITEAWPPTINHKAVCHRNGTCIDFDLSNPTPENIAKTIQAWDGANAQAVYEVKTQAEKDEILRNLSSADKERVKNNICVFPGITGSHFSGYATKNGQNTNIRQCTKG